MIHTVTLNPSLDRTLHYQRLVLGEVNRASHSRIDLSGKGVNVSAALRLLGVPSVVYAIVGGSTGRMLAEGLEAEGYDTVFVPAVGETRSNITVIDDATGVTTKLNESGATVTDRELALLERLLLARVAPGDWCVLSGSLPPGAPDETYAHVIAALQSRGVHTALDTSGEALALGCQARPDLVKPNEREAVALVGDTSQETWSQVAAAVHALGPRCVLLSRGAAGAVWADADGAWEAAPPVVREVSAVGAGDAALAGAVYGLQAGLSAADCLRWAAAMGGAKAAVDGTGMPALTAVIEMLSRITVRRLDQAVRPPDRYKIGGT